MPSKLGGDNVGAARGLHSKWSDVCSLLQSINNNLDLKAALWNGKSAAAEEQCGQTEDARQTTNPSASRATSRTTDPEFRPAPCLEGDGVHFRVAFATDF